MNSNEWRDQVLLAEAGELSKEALRALEERLAGDAELRGYRHAVRRLGGVVMASESGPSPAAMRTIRAAAEAQLNRGGIMVFEPRVLRRMAYAALVLIALGSWFVARTGMERLTRVSAVDRVEAVSAVVALTGDDGATAEASSEDEALRLLARRLLESQGLGVDVWESDDVDWLFSPDEAPTPTTTRWHNIPAPAATGCV